MFRLLLISLFPASLCAQARYELSFWGINNGLRTRSVSQTLPTERGVVWFATQHGLHLYDGLSIKVFDNMPESQIRLPSQIITSLAEDAQQRIWVTTAKGLVVIDANYRQLIPLNSLGIPDSVGTQGNCMLSEYNGNQMLLLSGQQLYTINSGGLNKWCTINLKLHNIEQFIFDAKRNRAYFLTIIGPIGYGFISADGKVHSLDASVDWPQQDVTSMQYLWRTLITEVGDSVSILFSGQYSLGSECRLMKYTPHSGQSRFETVAGYESVQPMWKIISDTLLKQPALVQAQLLTSLFLRHAVRDKAGNWWFSTTFGVIRITQRQIYFKHLAFTQYRSMRGMIQTGSNALILGGYNDVLHYPMPSGPLHRLDQVALAWWFYPIGHDTFITGLERQNGLWMIHEKPDGQLETFLPKPEWKQVAFSLCAAPMKKGIWVADARHRLLYVRYSDKALIPAPPALAKMVTGNLRAMHYSPASGLWVASTTGLYQFKVNQETEQIESSNTALLPFTLQSHVINAFCETSGGNMWLATSGGGLLQFTPSTHFIQSFTKDNGLPHDHIYSILPSHHGTVLWLGTQNGLCRFDRISYACQNYLAADGLEQSEFNTGATYSSANGIYYFGGINGVSYFDPELIPAASQSPPVVVTVFNMLNTQQVHQTIYPINGSTLVLQPDENYFDVQFHINQVSGVNTAFRFQLTDIQQDWQIGNVSVPKAFNTLPPGHYQLLVETQNGTGNWISAYTLQIEILPAWYETIWFKLLVVILLAGTAFKLYQFRTRYINHAYQLRKHISDDLNDDLGSRLQVLKQQAGKIIHSKDQEGNIAQHLIQLDNMTEHTLLSVRNFIWAYTPENDEIQSLVNRLTDFAESHIGRAAQQLMISTTHLNPEFVSEPYQRYHLLQVYQELLTNIIKHTLKPELNIRISIEQKQMQIVIVNQHQGKQTQHAGAGGIRNESMHRRLQTAGGQLQIRSDAHQQTIELTLTGK